MEALGRVARNLDFAAQVAKDYTKANLDYHQSSASMNFIQE